MQVTMELHLYDRDELMSAYEFGLIEIEAIFYRDVL